MDENKLLRQISKSSSFSPIFFTLVLYLSFQHFLIKKKMQLSANLDLKKLNYIK
jgi:hypothetical protein